MNDFDIFSILGRVFIKTHCYREPDVFQVVGWTKHSERPDAKRRTVFVRPVNFNANHHAYGGDGQIDVTDVLDITTPIYNQTNNFVKLTLVLSDDNNVTLRKREDGLVSEFYEANPLGLLHTWCDY